MAGPSPTPTLQTDIFDIDPEKEATGENFTDHGVTRKLGFLLNLTGILCNTSGIVDKDNQERILQEVKKIIDKDNKEKKVITKTEKYKILHILFSGKEKLDVLSNENKLKLLQILFIGEEKKINDLSDIEQIELLYKLFSGEESEILSDNKKNQEENLNCLSDTEKDKILGDLFSNNGTLDSSFLYKGRGANLYENISTDEEYPFMKTEIDCLRELKDNEKFKEILKKIKYITDVGSGDGQKAVALIGGTGLSKNWWGPTGWSGTYIPEDYSRDMLDIAEKRIQDCIENRESPDYNPDLKLGPSVKLNSGWHLSSNLSNNMFLFLGGTVCNMSNMDIIRTLESMDNNGLLHGNKLLLSYFTAPNTKSEIKKLLNIYNSESNRMFHENGMDMLGLSTNDFEFDTIYETDDGLKFTLDTIDKMDNSLKGPFPGRIKGIIRAKTDKEIKLSNNRSVIKVKKGEEFTLHYSRRFTKEGIEDLFEKSGCTPIFSMDKNGDTIVLLKKQPKGKKTLQELANKYKDKLFAIVAMGGVVGGALYATSIDKDHIDKQSINRLNKEYALRNPNSLQFNSDLYQQAEQELNSAFSLNEIKDEHTKKTIRDMFKCYINDHKSDSISIQELIRGFWDSNGPILINDLNVRHSPYDFITFDMVNLTKNVNKELTYIPNKFYQKNKIVSTRNYEDYGVFKCSRKKFPIEYTDGGKTYIILEVEIPDGETKKRVYFVGEKSDRGDLQCSTDMVNEIGDKTGLDAKILSNTIKLKENYVTISNIYAPDKILIENSNEDHIVKMSTLSELNISPNIVYLNREPYYIISVPTASGKSIGMASKTLEGPYTTTEFNHISKYFNFYQDGNLHFVLYM